MFQVSPQASLMFQVNPLLHMKNQALFSSKDKSKLLKCQFLFGALRVMVVHISHQNICCDPLLGQFCCDCSNERSQCKFLLRNKKNYLTIILKIPPYLELPWSSRKGDF